MDTIWSSSFTVDVCIYQTIPRHISEDCDLLWIWRWVYLWIVPDQMVQIKTPHVPAETLLFHWCISRNTELLLLFWLISSTTCIIQPVFRGAEWFLKIGCATERCANPVWILNDVCGTDCLDLHRFILFLPAYVKLNCNCVIQWHFFNIWYMALNVGRFWRLKWKFTCKRPLSAVNYSI